MSNVPEGAQLSEDGQYWWDGENWQQVEGANANENEANENQGTENGEAEVTENDVTAVGDTGVEPGDENLLDERLKPYFEPDYDSVEDDASYAEQGEVLDDSQATGGGGNTNENTNNNENESNENESNENESQEGN